MFIYPKKGDYVVLRKKSLLLSLLLGIILVVSACSNKEVSTNDNEETKKPSTLIISGDTVSEKDGCVLQSRFTVGDLIVWRMDAIDSDTLEQVKDAKLQVHLSTGEVLDMHFASHPPDAEKGAPEFWSVAYQVTGDTPTGVLEYYVTAEDGDRKGEYRPFNVQTSLLTIVPPEGAGNQEAEATEQDDTANIQTNQNVDVVATNFTFNEDKFYVKAGEEVTLTLTSKEGAHGITIPDLDVAINEPNGTVTFTPEKPGEYPMACSVYCGAGHGDMSATLVVVE